jgi:glycogen operon protein
MKPMIAPNPAPYRLGFHLIPEGAAISVWAPHAAGVELCLFDEKGEETRLPLRGPEAGLWHGLVPGLKAGQRYGLRAKGPWDPANGHRYNPARLLLDPYARGLEGRLVDATEDGFETILTTDDARDSAPYVPRGVLLAHHRHHQEAPRPRIPWEHTVIYEAHLKGLTRRMPGLPKHLRGTYAALGHDAVIGYLTDLGVTTLELLPLHAHATEPRLQRLGLTNYWGYNPLGFFSPHEAFATQEAQKAGPSAVLDELRGAIDHLHLAGLEVILDVVYNHTCEGDNQGLQVSWRGLDNRGYYRHLPDEPGTLEDVTGTGGTLDFTEPRVIQMALDSLRYWLTDIGVDGFRFDLAATLGRTGRGFDRVHPFLVGITIDPIIGAAKLIAEPWDIGPGGWQTGAFPAPMAEWNDRFRNTVRSFWLTDAHHLRRRSDAHGVRDLAYRLSGSSDIFKSDDPTLTRGPSASINFVACHDGFTLHDLTAYEHKHNETNGEGNGDGTTNNRSWNHGIEGPTDDPAILAARRRSARNLLGALLLSAGVPMIGAGDEFGRTQDGNNNAYCHDGETTWLDWHHSPRQEDLHATTRYLLALRRDNPVLQPSAFYQGNDDLTDRRDDLAWFDQAGSPATYAWWHDPSIRIVQMMRSLREGPDALIVINGDSTPAVVVVPSDEGPPWRLVWDSDWESPDSKEARAAQRDAPVEPGQWLTLTPHSMRLYLGVEESALRY